MTALPTQDQIQKTPAASMLAMAFLLAGLLAIGIYFVVSLDQSHLAASYWANSKVVRDSAPEGSDILATLAVLHARQSWLEPLKFTGLSLIIFGIALSFAITILRTLKMRLALTSAMVQQKLRR